MRLLFLLLAFNFACSGYAQPDTTNVPNSTNGWYLSPHGTVRVLLLFAEIEYDVSPARDPQPNGAQHWTRGALPTWKDNVFDPQPAAAYLGQVTRYYHDMSMGRFTMLGDYIDKVLTLRESEYPSVGNAHGIAALAVQEANKMGTLRTRHGLSIADFDLWKRGGKPGMPKQVGADDPHSYDHVMVIVRNSGLTHGQGSVDPGSPGKLFGFESDSQSRFGGMYALPYEILQHEYNHMLFGGNNFHSGGGNAAQFDSYTLCVQGGWSMMGAANSSLLTCSGWDRDRLGWLADDARFRINARDVDGSVVDGDVDPWAANEQLFVLRDFVTTGDALRIRIPFVPESENPQWLWLENHRTFENNGSRSDRFHWEETNNACLQKATPGLYMQMQIARDNKYGGDLFGGRADHLHPITACGHFDLQQTNDTLRDACPFGGDARPYRRIRANPLTGNCEQEIVVFDRNNDGAVERGEHFVPAVLVPLGGDQPMSPRFFGMADHAMRSNGVRRIDMGTNPSTANMLTLACAAKRETGRVGGTDNRVVRLNGMRVELAEERSDGSIVVRVSMNHTRITEDLVWCADSIVLPHLQGEDRRSLTLTSGTQLVIDRSLTPTRLASQGRSDGRTWFAPPTRFTIDRGASVVLEPKSELKLRTGSVMHLLPGSSLVADNKAKITVDGGCSIVVHGDAQFTACPRTEKKLRRSGRLIQVPDRSDP